MSQRLFIFTGKGGVGKTSLALAFTLHHKKLGKKIKYFSFLQHNPEKIINELRLDSLSLELMTSAEIYIARKLRSETIAHWIMKTPFFKSLFQMIPGLGHMILFGHIIDELEKDPELQIVIDAPASGHALTMFESTSTFESIFKSGLIVKDIDRMNRFIENPENIKTYLVTLPNQMSLQESLELKTQLDQKKIAVAPLIFNDCISPLFSDREKLPEYLINKLKIEDEILCQENMKQNCTIVSHKNHIQSSERILEISNEVSSWK